jgi:hypothetical protein
MKGYVYGFFDPREDVPASDPHSSEHHYRYIGQTINLKRPERHNYSAKNGVGQNLYFFRWLRHVQSKGYDAKWRIIDTCESWVELDKLEEFYIAWYRAYGHKLTNSTNGGAGVRNPSPEARFKIGSANRGKSPSIERRKKIAETNRQRFINHPELRKKVGDETRERIASMTPEELAERNRVTSEAIHLAMTPELRTVISEAGKAKWQEPEFRAKQDAARSRGEIKLEEIQRVVQTKIAKGVIPPRLNQGQIEEVKRLYASDTGKAGARRITLPSLAKQFNTNVSQISSILRNAGLAQDRAPRTPSSTEVGSRISEVGQGSAAHPAPNIERMNERRS